MTYLPLAIACAHLSLKGQPITIETLLAKALAGDIRLYFHKTVEVFKLNDSAKADSFEQAGFAYLARRGVPTELIDGSTSTVSGYFRLDAQDVQKIITMDGQKIRSAIDSSNNPIAFKAISINKDQFLVLVDEVSDDLAVPNVKGKRVYLQQAQEELILSTLGNMAFDPSALPPPSPDGGAKAKVRAALEEHEYFRHKPTVFEKAWERLREKKLIKDA